jgi:hypothetical protein
MSREKKEVPMFATDISTLIRQLEECVSQLKELEDAACKRGFDRGYEKGLRNGRLDVLNALSEFVHATEPNSRPEPDPQPESEKLDTLPSNSSDSLQRAVDYVEKHRGTTAWESREAIGRNTLYRAHEKGLVRREGKRFYPLNASSGS